MLASQHRQQTLHTSHSARSQPLHSSQSALCRCNASYRAGTDPLFAFSAPGSRNSSSGNSSSSSSSARWRPVPSVTCSLQHRHRSAVVLNAWFGQQQQQQRLWDYDGTHVKHLTLRELELLHRLSFGHRNQRSYLIVLYTPDSPACQAFEAEVERLASGLQHEPAFVAAVLDVSGSEAAGFVANMLKVDSVPAVLLYPEAARGCLKFLGPDMSALGMLAAINKARQKALPATASSPGAAEWRLIEAATPLTVTAVRAAAASGDTNAVVAVLQQQMQPINPTPLAVQQASSYWTAGRAQVWGGVLLCSLLFLAWDLKLSDLWEDWCLSRRQAARLQGRRFTAQENLDDLVTYMMKGLSGGLQQQEEVSMVLGQQPGELRSQQAVQDQQSAPTELSGGNQAPQQQSGSSKGVESTSTAAKEP